MKEAHVVEINGNEFEQQLMVVVPETDPISVMEHHPLMEIADSPGHLLLLKLWQREEHIYNRRIGLHETRMSSIRTELFQLCSFFFIFYGIFLTLIFTSSLHGDQFHTCKAWWVPAVLSGATSAAIVVVLQMRVLGYWKVWKRLEGERAESRAVVRAVQELRMKGKGFDLWKEVLTLNGGVSRMKSSSVQIRFWPVEVLKRNLVSICVACFAGLMPWACKFILCL